MKLKSTTQKLKNAFLPVTIIGLSAYLYKKRRGILAKSLLGISTIAFIVAPAHAQISEAQVHRYASTMKSAANGKNSGQIAKLLDDKVIVSLSRDGKSATLDKSAYLDMIQKNWVQTSNYTYDIQVDGVAISGDTARVQITTTESYTKDGKQTTLITKSRATLGLNAGNTVLMKSVSQVTIN